MKNAAKQLEFERAAALRDEIQDIRIRVLEQDASVAVLKAAERAASQRRASTPTAKPSERAAATRRPASVGDAERRPRSRRSRSPRSGCCPPARSWWTSTRARRPTCSRASRTPTRTTTRAGWRAGSTGPPGTVASRPTSSSERGHDQGGVDSRVNLAGLRHPIPCPDRGFQGRACREGTRWDSARARLGPAGDRRLPRVMRKW